jgi:ADP-heptose:LPS heptosyltransferase
MRIAETVMDMEIYKGFFLQKNTKYIMPGAILKQLISIYPGGIVESDRFEDYYNPINVASLPKNKTLLLFRSGGIGDVLFMLPLIKHLKKNFGAKIKAGTTPAYITLLKNNPYIDKELMMPLKLEEMKNSDYHLTFEGVIEDIDKEAKTIHAVDLFLKEANIDFMKMSSEDKIPELGLDKIHLKKIEKKLSYLKDDIKIGIQLQASSPIRTFPLEKLIGVLKELASRGYAIFIFGGKRQQDLGKHIQGILSNFSDVGKIVNLANEYVNLKDSIAFAKFMNLIIAPDSSFVHIAGALRVPIVGLYGCFPSLLRMKYYKNAIGIDANVPCAPSFIHGHAPCHRGDPPPCFSVISVKNILDAVDHLLKISRIEDEYPAFNKFKSGEMVESTFV